MLDSQILLQEIKWTSCWVYSGSLSKTKAGESLLYIYPGDFVPTSSLHNKMCPPKSGKNFPWEKIIVIALWWKFLLHSSFVGIASPKCLVLGGVSVEPGHVLLEHYISLKINPYAQLPMIAIGAIILRLPIISENLEMYSVNAQELTLVRQK